MMLDEFSISQPIVYKTIINSVKKERCSHAFIIETNGYPYSFDLARAFSKYLLCPKLKSNNKDCGNCTQCLMIDNNEFIELKIIEPLGQWIKKSQLDELHNAFSKKSLIGNKRVYIINGADKLNVASSNSLLKFLEEPDEGIIAILIVENLYQLLPTIISRCQIFSLRNKIEMKDLSTISKIANYIYDNEYEINQFLNDKDNKIKINKIIEFINFYEENHYDSIIYMNKLSDSFIKDKKDMYNAYSIMLLFYKDILNIKINKEIEVFNEYKEELNIIATKNEISMITYKINVIMNLREKIKFNVNLNLLMDKLIIELEGLI